MVEDRAERSQFRGIPLFSESDEINVTFPDLKSDSDFGSDFYGRAHEIYDLRGVAQLFFLNLDAEGQQEGHRGDEDSFSFIVVDGKLAIGNECQLEGMGMYSLYVYLSLNRRPDFRRVNCQILLPTNEILSGQLSREEELPDGVVLETLRMGAAKHTSFRFTFTTDQWQLKSETADEKLPFHVSKDPNFLSSLRFAFSVVSNPPVVQPTEE